MSSTTDAVLLDANVLIALTVRNHEHHDRARDWLGGTRMFATCPSTQGSLARYLVRVASTDHATAALELLERNPRHEFWPDELAYTPESLAGVVGHRQVTDAYLAASAAKRGSEVATFDRGLAALQPAATLLIG